MRTIRELRLDGFLSFPPDSPAFELRALNVLIGPNGSGKSNLIEALELLSVTPNDLAATVRVGGGPAEYLWKGHPRSESAEIEAVFAEGTPTGRPLRYRLRFTPVQSRLEILDEAIEELEPKHGEHDVYFYYRFQDGYPVLNIKDHAGNTLEVSGIAIYMGASGFRVGETTGEVTRAAAGLPPNRSAIRASTLAG